MKCNAPEDILKTVSTLKLEPLNCCLFSLSPTMVTPQWLRQPNLHYAVCAYKGHPLSESKTALGEAVWCWAGIRLQKYRQWANNLSDKIVNGLPEAHLNPTVTPCCKGRKTHSQ